MAKGEAGRRALWRSRRASGETLLRLQRACRCEYVGQHDQAVRCVAIEQQLAVQREMRASRRELCCA